VFCPHLMDERPHWEYRTVMEQHQTPTGERQVSFRCDEQLYQRLKRDAWDNERALAAHVRHLVRTGLPADELAEVAS
jgi:hypothetical protein